MGRLLKENTKCFCEAPPKRRGVGQNTWCLVVHIYATGGVRNSSRRSRSSMLRASAALRISA